MQTIKRDNKSYLDLKTLAQYSSLSVRTIREYLNDPDNPIPSFCLKRKILVRKAEFDRWMDAHRNDGNKINSVVDEILNDL